MRWLLLVVALFAAGPVVAGAKPPVPYVDDGACPFECCSYRDWTTQQTTDLRAAPDRKAKVVGAAFAGDAVEGLTGRVIVTRPGEFVVQRPGDGSRYAVGDRVFVYTPLGEGYFKVWHDGRMYEEEATFLYDGVGGFDTCVDADSCWGKRISLPEYVWWVQVRNSAGVTGWSDQPDHFGNKDACG